MSSSDDQNKLMQQQYNTNAEKRFEIRQNHYNQNRIIQDSKLDDVKIRDIPTNVSNVFHSDQKPFRPTCDETFYHERRKKAPNQDKSREQIFGQFVDVTVKRNTPSKDFEPKYQQYVGQDRRTIEIYGRDTFASTSGQKSQQDLSQSGRKSSNSRVSQNHVSTSNFESVSKSPLQKKLENTQSNIFHRDDFHQSPSSYKKDFNLKSTDSNWYDQQYTQSYDRSNYQSSNKKNEIGLQMISEEAPKNNEKAFQKQQINLIASSNTQDALYQSTDKPQLQISNKKNRLDDERDKSNQEARKHNRNYSDLFNRGHDYSASKQEYWSQLKSSKEKTAVESPAKETQYKISKQKEDNFNRHHTHNVINNMEKSIEKPVRQEEVQEKHFDINLKAGVLDIKEMKKFGQQNGFHIIKIIPEMNTITNMPTGKAKVVVRTSSPTSVSNKFNSKFKDANFQSREVEPNYQRRINYSETSNLNWYDNKLRPDEFYYESQKITNAHNRQVKDSQGHPNLVSNTNLYETERQNQVNDKLKQKSVSARSLTPRVYNKVQNTQKKVIWK